MCPRVLLSPCRIALFPGHAAPAHVLVEEPAAEVVAVAEEAVPELRARVAPQRGPPEVKEDLPQGGVGERGRRLEGICDEDLVHYISDTRPGFTMVP